MLQDQGLHAIGETPRNKHHLLNGRVPKVSIATVFDLYGKAPVAYTQAPNDKTCCCWSFEPCSK